MHDTNLQHNLAGQGDQQKLTAATGAKAFELDIEAVTETARVLAQQYREVVAVMTCECIQQMVDSGQMHAAYLQLLRQRGGIRSPKVPTAEENTTKTFTLPGPDELSQVTRALLEEQLKTLIASDENHLRIERERAALKEAEAKKRHQRRMELVMAIPGAIAQRMNTWVIMVLYGGAMLITGINLPPGVLCAHRGDFCYVFRFQETKMAMDDPVVQHQPKRLQQQK
ncbi:MAG: hypothetical protein JO235_10435 [Chroococcidiopsidaceae cyanobacterium CP_BM_RX_35]|nr:hypothetical protein [Chroococcidiopsidaceae cyanobacterium CP_BM_RX_35]